MHRNGTIPLFERGEIPLRRERATLVTAKVAKTIAATCSRRKKIGCFATGLRYGAIGRGICLKSELFKLRQAPKRRQRMLRNNRGAFFRLRFQAAGQEGTEKYTAGGLLALRPHSRASERRQNLLSRYSAVTTPRFRRGGERGSAPLPHSEPPYPRLLRNHFYANFAGSDASRSWLGALRFWLLLSHYKSSPLPLERNLSSLG